MVNWYQNLKLSYRGSDEPTMDRYRKYGPQDEKDDFTLTKAKPLFGGEKRRGYPRGISSIEEDDYSQVKKLPSEPTLMDQDPPTGEGANDERFVPDEDKMPIRKKLEPIGPHNMQERIRNENIFNVVSEKTKVKNLRL